MSLVILTSPLHAIGPKVWWEGARLRARTSRFWQIASLGAFCKDVEVDPAARIVVVRTRTFWSTEELEIPFDAITHVEYRFAGLVTGWTRFGDATDQVESYSVALALGDRTEVHLFSFHGAGSRTTGLTGVLLGDEVVDVQGDQGERSLSFVDELQRLTGKGLSRFSKGRRYR